MLEIDQIQIFIDTKIPGIKTPLLLTKHIIVPQNNEHIFPYFSHTRRIPKDYISHLNFKDRIDFFLIKTNLHPF